MAAAVVPARLALGGIPSRPVPFDPLLSFARLSEPLVGRRHSRV